MARHRRRQAGLRAVVCVSLLWHAGVLAGAAALMLSAKAQQPEPAVLRGTVRDADTGLPLAQCPVFVDATRDPHIELTDAAGRYGFTRLKPGLHQVQAGGAPGYRRSASQDVYVDAGAGVVRSFRLDHDTQTFACLPREHG